MGRAVQPRCRWGLTCSLPILQGQSEPLGGLPLAQGRGALTLGGRVGAGEPLVQSLSPARCPPLPRPGKNHSGQCSPEALGCSPKKEESRPQLPLGLSSQPALPWLQAE